MRRLLYIDGKKQNMVLACSTGSTLPARKQALIEGSRAAARSNWKLNTPKGVAMGTELNQVCCAKAAKKTGQLL